MKPENLDDMIEHRQSQPDRWGVTIPYDAIKDEFRSSFWLEFFRLRAEGKAKLEDVPALDKESLESNRRKMAGMKPKTKTIRAMRDWESRTNN